MPMPTQRELQKERLEEVIGQEEEPLKASEKVSRDGKSQRELQREELQRLLDPQNEQEQKEEKEAKMKSLEAKIAEMQAELEAMKASEKVKSEARQKRDQKRVVRQGNAAPATKGLDKFRAAGKRVEEEPSAFEGFGFNFEDLFKLGGNEEDKEEGSSEEYNVYGESDSEEKLAKRQEEAQEIIAKEKERMEGGALGRMRRGVTAAGGARERAAKRKGKKAGAEDAKPPEAAPLPEAADANPSEAAASNPFGFNFGFQDELLPFGQDQDSR
ncbi:unnamed protein product [Effrenium voratum]|uniref:Uncharacterized protein n=1 Tax=Effrenium voratum TaxID=2562239 RepID=A0AA36HQW7_9DINO|nr:unnamed protein product [Effrenium voratum]CAJ1373371.1 unnamed protein product [Effrenium voratum]